MTKNQIDLSAILSGEKPKKTASLGRGISALLGDAKLLDIKENSSEYSGFQVVNIPIKDCLSSKFQARKEFNQEELETLAESIKQKGLIQPVLLRKIQDNQYEIIAGERRCKASIIAGLSEVSAIIMDLTDKEVMEVGLIENLHRKDLNPLEEASAYKHLSDDFSYTHEDIAKVVGKNRSYISNFLRILALPSEVLNLIKEERLTVGHAKMLVNVENPLKLANEIVAGTLTVRDLETKIKLHKDSEKTKLKKEKFEINEELAVWRKQVRNSYKGLKIKVVSKSLTSGEVKIKYSDLEELKKVLGIL